MFRLDDLQNIRRFKRQVQSTSWNMIFVSGATGTVGTQLVERLAARGERVRGGVHHTGDLIAAAPQVQCVALDFSRPESLRTALEGCRKLYLVTPFNEDQVEMAAMLIDAAAESGVSYIVKQSVLGAGDESGTVLTLQHHAIERYLEESGIPHVFIRPSLFMQNFGNYSAKSIRQAGRFFLPAEQSRISYVDARDVASFAAEVLLDAAHAGQTYDLTGPEALTNSELAETLSRATGREIHYEGVSEMVAREAFGREHLSAFEIDMMLELWRWQKAAKGTQVTHTLEKVIRRSPYTFAEYARDHASIFGHAPAHRKETGTKRPRGPRAAPRPDKP
jgi:uncharacterized protein YbjT (DUF2867 family)